MTTAQDMDRMTARIVADALAEVRREAEIRETGMRCRQVCDDAVEAAREARLRFGTERS